MDSNTPLQPLPSNFISTTFTAFLKFLVCHPLLATLSSFMAFVHSVPSSSKASSAYAFAVAVPAYWFLIAVGSAYCYNLFSSNGKPDNLRLLLEQLRKTIHLCTQAFSKDHPLGWRTLAAPLAFGAICFTAIASPAVSHSLIFDTLLYTSGHAVSYGPSLLFGWGLLFSDIGITLRSKPFSAFTLLLAPGSLGTYLDSSLSSQIALQVRALNTAKTLFKVVGVIYILASILSPLGLAPLTYAFWTAALFRASEGGSISWSMNTSRTTATAVPQPA